jgi:PAS domain S-box-containing protein
MSGGCGVIDGNGGDVQLIGLANALRDRDLKFSSLADAIPHMVWSTLPDGAHDYYNAQWYEFTGVPEGSTDGDGWNDVFHPDDQERAWSKWRQSLDTGEPYEIEYRLRHRTGEYRWTLGRAVAIRSEDGAIVRWMGTCTDIHVHKLQAEQNEILSRELSHRIKNIFAVINGLIGLSSRQQPQCREFALGLQDRVAALGRAHEFVRPHSEQSVPGDLPDSLIGVIREILAPYLPLAGERITIAGEDVRIDDRGATPIALMIHELATNASKYGALSSDSGTVQIATRDLGDELEIGWLEEGGPKLAEAPAHSGFGTRLAELSIVGQLGGKIERDWRPEGLHATICVRRDRLARKT